MGPQAYFLFEDNKVNQKVAQNMLAYMKVREVMSYPLHTVKPTSKVIEAINEMVARKKSSVLIANEGLLKECLGILTASGIFKWISVAGLDPNEVTVSEIMTPTPLITINPDASCNEAAKLMIKHDIRRLPVVENGCLVGIITTKDILRCLECYD
jgi:CBS domain-containing protein